MTNRRKWVAALGAATLSAAGVALWIALLVRGPSLTHSAPQPTVADQPPVRIGLIPEREIFEQRRRYRALADYLAQKLGRPVQLLTVNSYESVLKDIQEQQIDGAFLGSLVTVLAMDQFDAKVLVKPDSPTGHGQYRGTIFVNENSPIRSLKDLAGKRVAMVRTTMGGHLYPMAEFSRCGLLSGSNWPSPVWVGTHDDVMAEVAAGRVDAGAAKDLRLIEYERTHPDQHLRRLCVSSPAPENALVVRAALDPAMQRRLSEILIEMNQDAAGQIALQQFGASRFVRCGVDEYASVYQMIESVRPVWDQLGIAAPAPKPPQPTASP